MVHHFQWILVTQMNIIHVHCWDGQARPKQKIASIPDLHSDVVSNCPTDHLECILQCAAVAAAILRKHIAQANSAQSS